MRLLEIEETNLQCLEGLGFRRGTVSKEKYPKLAADVMTVDFSGFPIFTHARVDDEIVRLFCIALERQGNTVEGKGSLPLERMCRDSLRTVGHPSSSCGRNLLARARLFAIVTY
jgi:hypothetical protein